MRSTPGQACSSPGAAWEWPASALLGLMLACLAPATPAQADDPLLKCIHIDGDAYAKYQLFDPRSATVSGKTADGESYQCSIDVDEVRKYPPDNHVPLYFRALGTLRPSSCSPDMTVQLAPRPDFIARPGQTSFHLYPDAPAVDCTLISMDAAFAADTGAASLLPIPAPDNRDLRAYIGLYPHEPVAGITFDDHPLVMAGIQSAMNHHEAMRWVQESPGPRAPVEPHQGRLLSWGCEAHNCGPHQWSLLIAADGTDPEVCYFDAQARAGQSLWFRQFQAPQWRDGTCQDAALPARTP